MIAALGQPPFPQSAHWLTALEIRVGGKGGTLHFSRPSFFPSPKSPTHTHTQFRRRLILAHTELRTKSASFMRLS